MRSGVAAALLLLAGCRQILGIDSPSEANGDASIDSDQLDDANRNDDAVPVDAGTCFGPAGWQLCFTEALMNLDAMSLPASLDTSTSLLCRSAPWASTQQPEACLIMGSSISVPGTTAVTGAKPLVLLATGTISVSGALEVRAAGNAMPCGDAILPQDSTSGTGGGGAGGSHQSRGGLAGSATSCPVVGASVLRGGIAGQTAGSGFGGAGTRAGGGRGGGAVYLVAGTAINITGAINASGGGGGGGTYYGGGGGGGAGGMIALYAPSITAIGVVMANGGGGGTCGINDASTDAGATPSISAPYASAQGGEFTGRPNGGDGCARGLPASNGSSVTGGGGGCGFILSNIDSLPSASVSPGLSPF